MNDDERKRAFEKIRLDRIARNGMPRASEGHVLRDTVSSCRLAGASGRLDLRDEPIERLRALLAFFDTPKLRPHYTGLMTDIRAELTGRGVETGSHGPKRSP